MEHWGTKCQPHHASQRVFFPNMDLLVGGTSGRTGASGTSSGTWASDTSSSKWEQYLICQLSCQKFLG